MSRSLFRVFNPIRYQGTRKKRPYFEGWYFKQVSAEKTKARTFSVIPGISKSAEGESAFVQTICGPEGTTRFFAFPFSDFSFSDKPFEVRIGSNRFSMDGIRLDLEDKSGRIRADLRFSGRVKPRAGLFSPGVMGPFSFAPFMECSHGIASLYHKVDGTVSVSGDDMPFSGGSGYIEKDWGTSMPSSWIWMQSNDFSPAIVGPASFSFSLARVPWRGSWFPGFICLFWVGNREYRFASYTGARVELLESDGESTLILLSDKAYKLEIQLRRSGRRGAKAEEQDSAEWRLLAPIDGALNRTIVEKMGCYLRIILKRRHGSSEDIITDAWTTLAAAEIAGDVSELTP